MMKRIINTVFFLVFIISLASPSNATLLGIASDYNAFIFGDMNTQRTDSQGRIAVGGDYTSTNFGMGGGAPSSQYSLISGGNVNYRHGSIPRGGIFANGDIFISNYWINGDVVANGSITDGIGIKWQSSKVLPSVFLTPA